MLNLRIHASPSVTRQARRTSSAHRPSRDPHRRPFAMPCASLCPIQLLSPWSLASLGDGRAYLEVEGTRGFRVRNVLAGANLEQAVELQA
jgi:hypothetical protein